MGTRSVLNRAGHLAPTIDGSSITVTSMSQDLAAQQGVSNRTSLNYLLWPRNTLHKQTLQAVTQLDTGKTNKTSRLRNCATALSYNISVSCRIERCRMANSRQPSVSAEPRCCTLPWYLRISTGLHLFDHLT